MSLAVRLNALLWTYDLQDAVAGPCVPQHAAVSARENPPEKAGIFGGAALHLTPNDAIPLDDTPIDMRPGTDAWRRLRTILRIVALADPETAALIAAQRAVSNLTVDFDEPCTVALFGGPIFGNAGGGTTGGGKTALTTPDRLQAGMPRFVRPFRPVVEPGLRHVVFFRSDKVRALTGHDRVALTRAADRLRALLPA